MQPTLVKSKLYCKEWNQNLFSQVVSHLRFIAILRIECHECRHCLLYEFHEGGNAKRILQSTCVVYRVTAAEHRCRQCFSKFEKSSAIFSKPYSGKSNTLYRNLLKPYVVADLLQRDLTNKTAQYIMFDNAKTWQVNGKKRKLTEYVFLVNSPGNIVCNVQYFAKMLTISEKLC